jgi:hypothetical protein
MKDCGPTIGPVTLRSSRGLLDRPIGAAKQLASDFIDILSLGKPTTVAEDIMWRLRPATQGEAVGAAAVDLYFLLTAPSVIKDLIGLKKQLVSAGQVEEILTGGGRPIIGAGTAKTLTDAPRLVETYGGQVADWAKVSSSAYRAQDGVTIEVHAYRNMKTGQVVELKSTPSSLGARP